MSEPLEIVWEYDSRPNKHVEQRSREMVAARLAEGDADLLRAAFGSIMREIIEIRSNAERTELIANLLLATSGIAAEAIKAYSQVAGTSPFAVVRSWPLADEGDGLE
jgi:hypothetical protein